MSMRLSGNSAGKKVRASIRAFIVGAFFANPLATIPLATSAGEVLGEASLRLQVEAAPAAANLGASDLDFERSGSTSSSAFVETPARHSRLATDNSSSSSASSFSSSTEGRRLQDLPRWESTDVQKTTVHILPLGGEVATSFTDDQYLYLAPWALNPYSMRINKEDWDDINSMHIIGTFSGGFCDSKYGYWVPVDGRDPVVRFRLDFLGTTESLYLMSVFGQLDGGLAHDTYGYIFLRLSATVARFNLESFSDVEVRYIDSSTDRGGFRGGFAAGDYVYLIPFIFNTVVRFKFSMFHAIGDPFFQDQPTSMSLGSYGNSELKSFTYGFTDGAHGYLVSLSLPNKLVRFNLQAFGNVEAFQLPATPYSSFSGAFVFGKYGYLVPTASLDLPCGALLRFSLDDCSNISLQDGLHAPCPSSSTSSTHFLRDNYVHVLLADGQAVDQSRVRIALEPGSSFPRWTSDSLVAFPAGLAEGTFSGGFTDGQYGYLVPYDSDSPSELVRFNLHDFSDVARRYERSGFWGGFSDGKYGYLVPHAHGSVLRFSLSDFDRSEYLYLEYGSDPLMHFRDGLAYGGHGYLFPGSSLDGAQYHGRVVRFGLETFYAIEVLDFMQWSIELAGFWGGFAAGDYCYLVPNVFSLVVRFRFSSFNLATSQYLPVISGTSYGYCGGFSAGVHGYLVPCGSSHVVRFDLEAFSLVEVLQLPANLQGFSGGFALNEHAYLVPRSKDGVPFGALARFHLDSFSNVSVFDLETMFYGYANFAGHFVINSSAYLIAAEQPWSGVRIALESNVESDETAARWNSDALVAFPAGLAQGTFSGGFTDGQYAYLVPYESDASSEIVRFNLHDFSDVSTRYESTGYWGGFSDCEYGYLVPHAHNSLVRFRLSTFGFSEYLYLEHGSDSLMYFRGGLAYGAYGYLFPSSSLDRSQYHGRVVRFGLKTFDAIEVLDLSHFSSDLAGFWGGFAAGDYCYLVPNIHSFVVRFRFSSFDLETFGFLSISVAGGTSDAYRGGFSAGAYGYLVPHGSSHLVRFDLETFDLVEELQLPANLQGFNGGFAWDGYGYLVPKSRDGIPSGKSMGFNLETFSNFSVFDLETEFYGYANFAGHFVTDSSAYFIAAEKPWSGVRIALESDVASADAAARWDSDDLVAFPAGLAQGTLSGGFTDGQYGYLVASESETLSEVIRFDLNNFSDMATKYETTGFCGGFSDGEFGYLVPHTHSSLARFRLSSFGTSEYLYLQDHDSGSLMDFRYGLKHGAHGYLFPGSSLDGLRYHGKVVRFRLNTFDSIEVLDLQQSYSDLAGFWGGFAAGDYCYLVPSVHTSVARFSFSSFGLATAQSLHISASGGAKDQFRGGFSSGAYGYLVPYDSSDLVRFDLDTFSLTDMLKLPADLQGFSGGFAWDGYGYLVPRSIDRVPSGKLTRFDLQIFRNVSVFDLEAIFYGYANFVGHFATDSFVYLIAVEQPWSGVRIALESDVESSDTTARWGSDDLVALPSGLEQYMGGTYMSGFTDGDYGYLVPHEATGSAMVVRFNLSNFSDVATKYESSGFWGGFSDGKYGYLVPHLHSSLVRFRLSDFDSSEYLNLEYGGESLMHYRGGLVYGRYGYLFPSSSLDRSSFHGRVTRFNCETFNEIEVLDVGQLPGFWGGFAAGDYCYLVPNQFSNLVRFSFSSFAMSGVQTLYIDSLVATDLFHGGFSDGEYGYLVPFESNELVRFDLKTFSRVEMLRLPAGLRGFSGGFALGRYGYLVPHSSDGVPSGDFTRFSLDSFSNVSVFNLESVFYGYANFADHIVADGFAYLLAAEEPWSGVRIELDAKPQTAVTVVRPEMFMAFPADFPPGTYLSGFTDGEYGYLIPHESTQDPLVVRFNLHNFSDVATRYEITGFLGGFSDGIYGYLVPHTHRSLVRFRLSDFDGSEYLYLNDGSESLMHFRGGLACGAYGYLFPGSNLDRTLFHGKVTRFNLDRFDAIEVLDLATWYPDLQGFWGGFAAGDYCYLVPNQLSVVARFSFSAFSLENVHRLYVSAAAAADFFHYGFAAGSYGYLVPFGSSALVRFDLHTFSQVEVLQLPMGLQGFSGGFALSGYGYLVPRSSDGVPSGKMARFSLDTFGNISVFDLEAVFHGYANFADHFVVDGFAYLIASGDPWSGVRIELGCDTDTSTMARWDSDELMAFPADLPQGGHWSGFTDGEYAYLIPYAEASSVVRFDLHSFNDVATLYVMPGFWGGFSDGRYGYLVPSTHSSLVRFRLSDFGGSEHLNLQHGAELLTRFHDGLACGTHGYLFPGSSSSFEAEWFHGKVARFNLNTFDAIEVLNLVEQYPDLRGFRGGFPAGDYCYLVPNHKSMVARFSFSAFSIDSVQSLDTSAYGFHGGFAAGSYGYLVPSMSRELVRFDLHTFSQVEVLQLPMGLLGFRGGFALGGYGYLVPRSSDGIPSGEMTRFSLETFGNVSVFDLKAVFYGYANFADHFVADGFAYLIAPEEPWSGVRIGLDTDADTATTARWKSDELTAFPAGLPQGFHSSGFTDGEYAYLIPFIPSAEQALVRFNLNNFSDVSARYESDGYWGGFSDGKYGYLVPNTHSTLVRFRLSEFDRSEYLDLQHGSDFLKHFRGGLPHGAYGYLFPGSSADRTSCHGKITRFNLKTFDAIEVLDLGTLPPCFWGGFAAGDYCYLVPSQFGILVRFSFSSFSIEAVKTLHISTTAREDVFHGGFSDGEYGYLVPYGSTELVRFDLTTFSHVDMLSLPEGLQGFSGGFVWGRYGYLVPHWSDGVQSGNLTRFSLDSFGNISVFDLEEVYYGYANFADHFVADGVAYLLAMEEPWSGVRLELDPDVEFAARARWDDLMAFPAGLLEGVYRGGFSDGRYGYLIPEASSFGLIRLTLNNFSDVSLITGISGYSGGFTDDTYGYLVPHMHSDLVRFNLETFGPAETLQVQLDGQTLNDFLGGLAYAGYGYLFPSFQQGSTPSHGKVVRFDLDMFESFEVLDLEAVNFMLVGFWDGFAAGDYCYLVPNIHTFVARFSFSRFCEPSSVQELDLSLYMSAHETFHGGFSSGAHGYLAPFGSSNIVRFDLQTFSQVEVLQLPGHLMGFNGGFARGGCGYLVPQVSKGEPYGALTRFSLEDFGNVSVFDLESVFWGYASFTGHFIVDDFAYLLPLMEPWCGVRMALDPEHLGWLVERWEGDDLVAFPAGLAEGSFVDGFSHGGYGYLVQDGLGATVVRINLDNFSDVSSRHVMYGFSGGFSDARYCYLVPYSHATAARFPLYDFEANIDMLFLDYNGEPLVNFRGGLAYGSFGYLFPSLNENAQYHGKLTRFSLDSFDSVEVFDMELINYKFAGFWGGFLLGDLCFLMPSQYGSVARLSLSDFGDSTAVQELDLCSQVALCGTFRGGFSDGTYAYVLSLIEIVVRFDLQSFGGVESLELSGILRSFSGGFAWGEHGYLVPKVSFGEPFGGLTRFSLDNFSDVSVFIMEEKYYGFAHFSGHFVVNNFAYLIASEEPWSGVRIKLGPPGPTSTTTTTSTTATTTTSTTMTMTSTSTSSTTTSTATTSSTTTSTTSTTSTTFSRTSTSISSTTTSTTTTTSMTTTTTSRTTSSTTTSTTSTTSATFSTTSTTTSTITTTSTTTTTASTTTSSTTTSSTTTSSTSATSTTLSTTSTTTSSITTSTISTTSTTTSTTCTTTSSTMTSTTTTSTTTTTTTSTTASSTTISTTMTTSTTTMTTSTTTSSTSTSTTMTISTTTSTTSTTTSSTTASTSTTTSTTTTMTSTTTSSTSTSTTMTISTTTSTISTTTSSTTTSTTTTTTTDTTTASTTTMSTTTSTTITISTTTSTTSSMTSSTMTSTITTSTTTTTTTSTTASSTMTSTTLTTSATTTSTMSTTTMTTTTTTSSTSTTTTAIPRWYSSSLTAFPLDSIPSGFYSSGFTDGTFGYLVPEQGGDGVVRMKLDDLNDITVLDLMPIDLMLNETLDSLAEHSGFSAGFTDGTYGYLVPYYHNRLTRFDLETTSMIEVLDLSFNSEDLTRFQGGLAYGSHGYLFPSTSVTATSAAHGKVVRFDLFGFTEVAVLDLVTIREDLVGFWSGFTDGMYCYLVPHTYSTVARFTLLDFSSVDTLGVQNSGFRGGFIDGTFGYLVPNSFGTVVRFDLQRFSLVETLQVPNNFRGFNGGFVFGDYGYLVPDTIDGSPFGALTRFSLQSFSDVTALYLEDVNSDFAGFVGHFVSDRYAYLVAYSEPYVGVRISLRSETTLTTTSSTMTTTRTTATLSTTTTTSVSTTTGTTTSSTTTFTTTSTWTGIQFLMMETQLTMDIANVEAFTNALAGGGGQALRGAFASTFAATLISTGRLGFETTNVGAGTLNLLSNSSVGGRRLQSAGTLEADFVAILDAAEARDTLDWSTITDAVTSSSFTDSLNSEMVAVAAEISVDPDSLLVLGVQSLSAPIITQTEEFALPTSTTTTTTATISTTTTTSTTTLPHAVDWEEDSDELAGQVSLGIFILFCVIIAGCTVRVCRTLVRKPASGETRALNGLDFGQERGKNILLSWHVEEPMEKTASQEEREGPSDGKTHVVWDVDIDAMKVIFGAKFKEYAKEEKKLRIFEDSQKVALEHERGDDVVSTRSPTMVLPLLDEPPAVGDVRSPSGSADDQETMSHDVSNPELLPEGQNGTVVKFGQDPVGEQLWKVRHTVGLYHNKQDVEYYSRTLDEWLPGHIEMTVTDGKEARDPKITYNVLFMNGRRQMRRNVRLEVLRKPLEDGDLVEVVPESRVGKPGRNGWLLGQIEGHPNRWHGAPVRLEGPDGQPGKLIERARHVRRYYPDGFTVEVYRGPTRGWVDAVVEQRDLQGEFDAQEAASSEFYRSLAAAAISGKDFRRHGTQSLGDGRELEVKPGLDRITVGLGARMVSDMTGAPRGARSGSAASGCSHRCVNFEGALRGAGATIDRVDADGGGGVDLGEETEAEELDEDDLLASALWRVISIREVDTSTLFWVPAYLVRPDYREVV